MKDYANKCLACFVNPSYKCDNCGRNWCGRHWTSFNNRTEPKMWEGKWTFHCTCDSVLLRCMHANKLIVEF